jgi:hypothetical protein
MLGIGVTFALDKGMRVSSQAREVIEGGVKGRPLTTGDYASTSGIALDIGESIFVNTPFSDYNPNFVTSETPYSLEVESDRFYLQYGPDQAIEVSYVPVPAYYGLRNISDRERLKDLVVTHTDRARISPIEGCAIACQFCNLPYEYSYRKKQIPDLVDAVSVALRDEVLPAQHVLISGGTPKPQDYKYENEVYRSVAQAFPGLPIDVMMAPKDDLLDPRLLRRWGINELSINLEVYNADVARRWVRGKHNVGRDKYLRFIEDAVGVFGVGKIRSLLLVGLEPIEDTLRGVEELARRGCDPVLSPFRPDPATPLRNLQPPSSEMLTEAYQRAKDIVGQHQGVELGPRCIPCMHNTLTFPDNSGAYYFSKYDPESGTTSMLYKLS